MHILTSQSAIDAIRAIRFRESNVSLPDPEPAHTVARLPKHKSVATVTSDHEYLPEESTLADVSFPFDSVEINTKVDFWKIGGLGSFSPNNPLHLGVFERKDLRNRRSVRTKMLWRDLPADALIKIDPNLYCAGPELAVLQMAPQLDALELAQVIMELCGSYALKPNPADEGQERRRCNYDARPVTTLARIAWYAARVRTRGGTKTLNKALGMARELSASPAETILSLVMSQGWEAGGYGFGQPALNASLEVPEDERDNVDGTTYYLDAFWQDAYADLEYESTAFHLDPLIAGSVVSVRAAAGPEDPEATRVRRAYITKADADRRRMRDLQYLGIRVIPVTDFDLKSTHRMDQVARALARCFEEATGKPLNAWHRKIDEHRYREARRSLLQRLQPEAVILS